MNNLNPYLILLNEFSMRQALESGKRSAILFHMTSFAKNLEALRAFYNYCGLPISNKKIKDLANAYLTGRIHSTSLSPLTLGTLIKKGERLTGGQMKYLEDVKRGLRKIIF